MAAPHSQSSNWVTCSQCGCEFYEDFDEGDAVDEVQADVPYVSQETLQVPPLRRQNATLSDDKENPPAKDEDAPVDAQYYVEEEAR